MTSTQFLELAVSVSVQAAILVAAAHELGRWVSTQHSRCRLWAAAYVGIVLAVLAGVFLPHPRLAHPWTAASAETTLAVVSAQQRAGALLFAAWLIGAATCLVRLIAGELRAACFLRTCLPLDAAALPPVSLERVGRWRRVDRVRLLTSPRLVSPFCWQFHRPYIVLPEFVLEFDRGKLAAVLRHELEHLHCGHPLQLFVQHVVETIFWFHPLIRWASHQTALAREFACDDAAIDSPADVADYLRSLLAVVEQGNARATQSPTVLSFGRGEGVIAARARRLVGIARSGSPRKRRRVSAAAAWLGAAAAIVAAACTWVPVDALASPRAGWSPWPSWTADVLHDMGLPARDFETYDRRVVLHELLENVDPSCSDENAAGEY